MSPDCIVCGHDVSWDQEAGRASWGPITIYFHTDCDDGYRTIVAPRLRDALQRAIKRWYSQQRRTHP